MRGSRLTRVRGVPLAGEALGFGDLGGGHLTRKAVAGVDGENPLFARSPRRRKDDRRY